MGLFDWFKTESKAATIREHDGAGPLPAKVDLTYTRHSFTPVTDWAGAYKLWKENPVAQGCTMAYSLTMPEAMMGVVKGDAYDYEHQATKLFTGNSWRLSMAKAMTYLCVGGNIYYHKERNASGAVINLAAYSDENFAPVPDGHGGVKEYHYTDGVLVYIIPKEDVVHIKGFWVDPKTPYAGGSPVVLASTTIESYNEASGTVFSIHKNDAMPKTAMIYDEELSPEQIAVAEQSFKRKYGGQRRGSVGHFWGVKDIKRLALDYDELGMENTFAQYEARICGVYRVHPIIAYTHAGLMSSTFSNSAQASKDFTDMVRVPLWHMIADQINEQLAVPDFGVEIGFDLSTVEALKPSAESVRVSSTAAFTAGIMTLPEARNAYGLLTAEENVDPTGETAVALNGAQIASLIDIATQVGQGVLSPESGRGIAKISFPQISDAQLDEIFNNITPTAPEGGAPAKGAGFRVSYKGLGEVSDEVYFKAYDDVAQDHAEKIAKAWAGECAKLEAELVSSVKSLASRVETKNPNAGIEFKKSDPFDVEKWTKRFLEATEEERIALIEEMIRLASEDVDAEGDEFSRARKSGIKESSDKIADSIGTIKDEVQAVLKANAGASGEELAQLLTAKFETLKVSRANAIGRTTATATTGTVQKDVWAEMNDRETDPKRKIIREWLSEPGARDAHETARGQKEDADGMFTVGGERTPYPAGPNLSADNSVNCRCTTRARRAGATG